MTNQEKQKIEELRKDGLGYGAIAATLGLNKNSVKSHIKRLEESNNRCLYCGKEIKQDGRKIKRFCSDICRLLCWKKDHKGIEIKCSCCGETFYAYKSRNRKYCSQECYIKEREGHRYEWWN